MIGQSISHYRILSKLGEGGVGLVHKAEDAKLGRTVAPKFLPPHAEENRERFLREAQAAVSLNHPNLCTIFEIDEGHGFTRPDPMGCDPMRSSAARHASAASCWSPGQWWSRG